MTAFDDPNPVIFFEHKALLVYRFTFFPEAGAGCAVGIGFGAFPIGVAVFPLAAVFAAVGVITNADAVDFAVFEIADIFCAGRILECSFTIRTIT